MEHDSITSFTRATWNAVRRDGLDSFLPTLLFPDRDHLVVLEGVPPLEDLSAIAHEWAADAAKDEQHYILAYRSGRDSFTITQYKNGATSTATHVVRGA